MVIITAGQVEHTLEIQVIRKNVTKNPIYDIKEG